MRSGKLDAVILVRRPGEPVDDGAGNFIPGETTTIATLRAQVIQASTEEFIRAWGASSESVLIFRTRHLDGVLLSDLIRYDGDDYNLKEIKPIGRWRGLELRCYRSG